VGADLTNVARPAPPQTPDLPAADPPRADADRRALHSCRYSAERQNSTDDEHSRATVAVSAAHTAATVTRVTDSPALDLLLPVDRARRFEPRDDEAELLALFDDAPARHVRANMVSTVDGGGTGRDDVSGSINGPADNRIFQVLRALADVVVVGAGTARDEGYTPLHVPASLAAERRRRGLHDPLELAVVSASGAVPAALLDADRPPFVLTTPGCPDLAELRRRVGGDHVIATGSGRDVDLGAALSALAARGLTRVLAEGGPGLLAQLVAADLIDELCLTWSPLLVGGPAPRVLRTDDWLDPPRRLVARHLLHADGTLLGRWQVARA